MKGAWLLAKKKEKKNKDIVEHEVTQMIDVYDKKVGLSFPMERVVHKLFRFQKWVWVEKRRLALGMLSGMGKLSLTNGEEGIIHRSYLDDFGCALFWYYVFFKRLKITGVGKNTTVYALLNSRHEEDRNIISQAGLGLQYSEKHKWLSVIWPEAWSGFLADLNNWSDAQEHMFCMKNSRRLMHELYVYSQFDMELGPGGVERDESVEPDDDIDILVPERILAGDDPSTCWMLSARLSSFYITRERLRSLSYVKKELYQHSSKGSRLSYDNFVTIRTDILPFVMLTLGRKAIPGRYETSIVRRLFKDQKEYREILREGEEYENREVKRGRMTEARAVAVKTGAMRKKRMTVENIPIHRQKQYYATRCVYRILKLLGLSGVGSHRKMLTLEQCSLFDETVVRFYEKGIVVSTEDVLNINTEVEKIAGLLGKDGFEPLVSNLVFKHWLAFKDVPVGIEPFKEILFEEDGTPINFDAY